jgi:hypothetical protein
VRFNWWRWSIAAIASCRFGPTTWAGTSDVAPASVQVRIAELDGRDEVEVVDAEEAR